MRILRKAAPQKESLKIVTTTMSRDVIIITNASAFEFLKF